MEPKTSTFREWYYLFTGDSNPILSSFSLTEGFVTVMSQSPSCPLPFTGELFEPCLGLTYIASFLLEEELRKVKPAGIQFSALNVLYYNLCKAANYSEN